MESYIIYPILGLRTDVVPNDPMLFKQVMDGHATHCVEGRNINFSRRRNTTAKSLGKYEWSNSAIGTPTACQGVYEQYDGTNRVIWIAYDGNVYRYDANRDPNEVADAGATAFASGVNDFYSFITYGSYMVFSDWGEHTPYCSDYNDANLAKLVTSGTEYKARYLESFQRRIIGAFVTSGITSFGNISIIWTDANPVPGTSCTFGSGDPPSNHLYLPVDDPIRGIKRMGRNQCFVYGSNSINRLDYYIDYTNPFGFTTVVENQGFEAHHSIVDVGGVHYGYNRNYGFCRYDGSNVFPSGGYPISYPIENVVSSIRDSGVPYIYGTLHKYRNEICWTVPIDGATAPNAMLFYNYLEDKWRRVDFECRCLSGAVLKSNLAWSGLAALGYSTWEDFGSLRWADLYDETQDLIFSGTDGKLYYHGTEGDDGSDFDGYRVEPILDFGKPNDRSLLLEIWFNIVQTGNYNLYVHHRSGDTIGECLDSGWTALDEVSCNSPANAVTRTNKNARYHQIKWGTDAANEVFIINKIEFKYVSQGRY